MLTTLERRKMKYNFKDFVDRSTYSRKWQRMNKDNPNIVDTPPFSVADTDFKYPDQLIEKFNEYTKEMVFGYTRPDDFYYESIFSWYKRRHDFEIKRDWFLDASGVVVSMYHSLLAFSNEGDGVIIMSPVYPPFKQSVIDTNRVVVDVPLKLNERHYEIDFEHLEKVASDDNNKILFLCSPHNPVGRVWSEDELLRLSDICNRNNVLVVSDEIHMDLVLNDNKHIVYGSLNEENLNHSVILSSASKTFNLAGAQTSFVIIANEKLRAKFQAVLDTNAFFGINAFGFKLTEIAYNDCEDWLDELLELVSSNHKYLFDYINNNIDNVYAYSLEGTFLQWIDFSGLNMSDEELFSFLADECNLYLTAGKSYGSGGQQHLRWNIATPREVMIAGLKRLKDCVDKLG